MFKCHTTHFCHGSLPTSVPLSVGLVTSHMSYVTFPGVCLAYAIFLQAVGAAHFQIPLSGFYLILILHHFNPRSFSAWVIRMCWNDTSSYTDTMTILFLELNTDFIKLAYLCSAVSSYFWNDILVLNRTVIIVCRHA